MSEVAVTLRADTSDFTAKMNGVQNSFEEVLRGERRVGTQMKDLAATLTSTTDPAEALANTIFRLGNSLKIGLLGAVGLEAGFLLFEQFQKAKEGLDKVQEAVEKISAEDVGDLGFSQLGERIKTDEEGLKAISDLMGGSNLKKGLLVASGSVLGFGGADKLAEIQAKNKAGFEHDRDKADARREQRALEISNLELVGDKIGIENIKKRGELEDKIIEAKEKNMPETVTALEAQLKNQSKLYQKQRDEEAKKNEDADSKELEEEEKRTEELQSVAMAAQDRLDSEEKRKEKEKAKAKEESLKRSINSLRNNSEFSILNLNSKGDQKKLDELKIKAKEIQDEIAIETDPEKRGKLRNDLKKVANEERDLANSQSGPSIGGVSSLQRIGGGGGFGLGNTMSKLADDAKRSADNLDKLVEHFESYGDRVDTSGAYAF